MSNQYVVLTGGFTGDGSSIHRLYRNENGDRVLVFNTMEDAQKCVLQHRMGKHSLIAEVVVTATPALQITRKTGVDYYSLGTDGEVESEASVKMDR